MSEQSKEVSEQQIWDKLELKNKSLGFIQREIDKIEKKTGPANISGEDSAIEAIYRNKERIEKEIEELEEQLRALFYK